MSVGTRVLFVVLLVIPLVACDQAAKLIAQQTLGNREVVELLDGFVRFELTSNRGAFLSLGEDLPQVVREIVLIGAVPVALAIVLVAVGRSSQMTVPLLIGIGLVIGGGLGNWIDRTLHDGHVIDFVSLGFDWLRTGIFNVADVAIVGGVIWVGISARPRPELRGETAHGERST